MARPSKLTRKIRDTVVEAIEIGCTYQDAARNAGISYEVFRLWRKAGEAALQRLAAGAVTVEGLSERERQCVGFYRAVERAEARCAVGMQRVIYEAAQHEPQWAAWWLERRRSEAYGVKQRVNVQGDGMAIRISKIEVGGTHGGTG